MQDRLVGDDGHDRGRTKAITQMMRRWRSSPRCSVSVMLSGEGFSLPLAEEGECHGVSSGWDRRHVRAGAGRALAAPGSGWRSVAWSGSAWCRWSAWRRGSLGCLQSRRPRGRRMCGPLRPPLPAPFVAAPCPVRSVRPRAHVGEVVEQGRGRAGQPGDVGGRGQVGDGAADLGLHAVAELIERAPGRHRPGGPPAGACPARAGSRPPRR